MDQLDSLEKNASENELILKELQESLETNMQTRKRCQMMLMKLQSSKKKEMLELQIAMRKLKLEKTNLFMQNLEIKQVAIQAQLENEAKEEQLRELQQQAQLMN